MPNPCDAWLRRRGIAHPVMTPVVRNVLLTAAFLLAAGAVAWGWRAWPLWAGVGAAIPAWIFWGLARFFLRRPLGEYSTAFLRVVLLRFVARMLVLAVAVYVILVECAASPFALVGGLTVGFAVALATFAAASRQVTRR